MVPEELRELRDDLLREEKRLERLVRSLEELLPRLEEPHAQGPEVIEAAALRLHSFYTGVERCLLLERMAMATEQRPALLREETQSDLQAYLRFRHLVRNLYSDELRAEPIALLIDDLPEVWRKLSSDLEGFREWLASVVREADMTP